MGSKKIKIGSLIKLMKEHIVKNNLPKKVDRKVLRAKKKAKRKRRK